MKSKVFSSKVIGQETILSVKNDFKSVWKFSDDQISYVLQFLPILFESDKRQEFENIVNNIIKETKMARGDCQNLLSIILFFSQLLVDDNFAPEKEYWYEDMLELEILENKDSERYRKLINIFTSSSIDELKIIDRKKYYNKGLFPHFKKCDIMVEDRLVVDKSFEYGEDIDKFSPNVLSTIPVITIDIQTDMEAHKNLLFQASPAEVQFLINKLFSALKLIEKHKS